MSIDEIESARNYLLMVHLIRAEDLSDKAYTITPDGIQEIEQLIESPYRPTAHLPTMTVNIGQNINSPIQQSIGNAVQQSSVFD